MNSRAVNSYLSSQSPAASGAQPAEHRYAEQAGEQQNCQVCHEAAGLVSRQDELGGGVPYQRSVGTRQNAVSTYSCDI